MQPQPLQAKRMNMTRKSMILAGACLALTSPLPLLAQTVPYENVSIQQFQPTGGTTLNFNHVSGASTLKHLQPSAGLWLNYGHRPLVATSTAGDLEQALVGPHLAADLVASLGLFNRLQLGLALPVSLLQVVDSEGFFPPPSYASSTVGDVRLHARAHLLKPEDKGLNVGLEGQFGLPTGDKLSFEGNGNLTIEPRLLLEYTTEKVRVGANVGYVLRTDADLYTLPIGNELSFGLGAAYALMPEKVTLLAELFGKAGVDADTTAQLDAENNGEYAAQLVPLEANIAARLTPMPAHALTVGVGPGLSEGYGTPTFRFFVGYSLTPAAKAPPKDTDGDGIIDKDDACPKEAEDKDKFQDQDGCSDPDNDQDGILDSMDVCPDQPEDKDGFKDEDGCDDPDNDGDGVLDKDDKCPDSLEDRDNVADNDGCEDPDNDGDGVLDKDDKCPMFAEDKDGLGDEDGCPEDDFDKDGIKDAADQCPRKPETINGNKDEDGCPDEGKSLVQVTKDRVEILEKVYFDTGKDSIQTRSFGLLRQVALIIKANPEITKIRVEGHTDNVGDDASNLELSQRRANEVVKFLVNLGVDASRLVAVGYGETKPVADNATAKGKEQNRRVVFTIIELDGKPVETHVIEKTSTETTTPQGVEKKTEIKPGQ